LALDNQIKQILKEADVDKKVIKKMHFKLAKNFAQLLDNLTELN
jgi:hypothetical protein